MSWFKIVIAIWIMLVWNDRQIVSGVQAKYSLGVILTFPRKYVTIFDLNQLGYHPSTVKLIDPIVYLPRFFLTDVGQVERILKEYIQRALNHVGDTSLVVGGANMTIIGTDELRFLRATNINAYEAAVNTIDKVVRGFQVFNNQVAISITNVNDEAWSHYSMGMLEEKIKQKNGLISINRYSIVLVLKLNDDELIGITNYTSKDAINDGFNNYLSVLIDCAGPEYMEIKTNNYVSRVAKESKKPPGTEIPFPCYPYGTRFSHDLPTNSKDYEYCDHETYAFHKPLHYIQVGSYNKAECYQLLDKIIKSRYGCAHIPFCAIGDIPSNILKHTVEELVFNINWLGRFVEDKSPISQAWFDAEIGKACSPQTTEVPAATFEKCFYLTYLNYIYDYLKLNEHKYSTTYGSYDWFRYFIFGAKVLGSDGTTQAPNPNITTPNGGGCPNENNSNLVMILGIIFGVLVGLLILGFLVYLIVNLNKKKSAKYNVVEK